MAGASFVHQDEHGPGQQRFGLPLGAVGLIAATQCAPLVLRRSALAEVLLAGTVAR